MLEYNNNQPSILKSNFNLREYQQAFKKNISIGVRDYERIIACAATGSGKSKTFLSIADSAIKKSKTNLVITESSKIYNQLINEAHAIEINAGSKLKEIRRNNIYLAMAQTLARRPKLIEQFDALKKGLLIINDEAHINTATGILKQLPQSLLIGFTATPVGKHLVDLYNNIVIGPQPHELVLGGHLAPYKHFERQRVDLTTLERDRTGEYTEESQDREFNKRYVYDGLIEDLRTMRYKKCLIFTASIRSCMLLTEELRANGFSCVPVHSQLKEEAFNLFQFEHGLVPICICVAILTKGYDYPPIDLVVLHRKIASLPLYLQCCGRGSRTHEGKELFTVLDYGGNCTEHYPWDWERDWATMWNNIKPKRPGVAPIKVCPQCNFVNNAQARICVNCGHAFLTINVNNTEDAPDSVLVEITEKYGKLIGKKISTLTAQELSTYAKCKNKRMFAIRVAKWHHQQGDHQFLHDYAKAMNYSLYWCEKIIEQIGNEPIEFNDVELK